MLNATSPAATDQRIQIGEIAIVHVAVVERQGDRLLVSFERDGQPVKEWFRESELIGLGFDD